MGDLRLKAKEILKLKQLEKEASAQNSELSLEELIKHKKTLSKIEFKAYINREIEDFQTNLLEAANRGEPLRIDIFSMEKDSYRDKEDVSIKSLMKYLPVQQKIVTFLEDTSFELIADEIIVDDNLQKLYSTIVENGIYPEWKIKDSENGKETILYLEANPLNGYEERKSQLKQKLEQRRKVEQHAVVLYKQNIEKSKKEQKREKIKNFFFIFSISLYSSVVLLTVLAGIIGLFPLEYITNTFGLIALAWPYFLFSSMKAIFLFSLPLGIAFSFYLALRKS